jgi:hypothetical protein
MSFSTSAVLDPASIFSVREVSRIREIDYEIESSINHNSPQALLRDLHRPIRTFGVNPLEFDKHERIVDGGRASIAEVKVIIYTNYRIPIEALIPTRAMYRESVDERKSVMRAPWTDAPKFGKQYLPGGMTFW